MKMNKHIFLTLIALLLSALVAFADGNEAENAAKTAEKEYAAGNYAKAAEIYESLLKSEGRSPGLLYNLGNTHVKMHDYGQAMLCFKRARRLDPRNDKINNNIDYIAQQVDVQNRAELKGKPLNVSPEDPWFFSSVYSSFARDVRSDAWAMFAAVAFILCLFFIADYIFTKRVLIRKFGFFGAIIMLGFTVVFLVFAFCAASEADRHDNAIIIASKIELLAEPDAKAKSVSTLLNRGTEVEIIKTEGGTAERPEWYNVRLNSDYSGWIKAGDVEPI